MNWFRRLFGKRRRKRTKDMTKPWWNDRELRSAAAKRGAATRRQMMNKLEIQINESKEVTD